MFNYYDWNKTLSYDADVTMVIGARGLGKTYGLRLQFVKDWIKRRQTFVEVSRTKDASKALARGYFAKIGNEFPMYVFKCEGDTAYIAEKTDGKPVWQTIGYFVALTQEQQIKTQSSNYANVHRILLDEAILDKHDRYHRYLPREWDKLAGIVDSVTRERPEDTVKPHVYLLGNALDLLNPYFEAAGIDDFNIDFGYRWYRTKTFLLHYVQDQPYAQAKLENTVSGRMLFDSENALEIAANEFITQRGDLILKNKPAGSRLRFAVVCAGYDFTVYECLKQGIYYVDGAKPNAVCMTFAITRDDMTIDRRTARKSERALLAMSEFHYQGMLRYSDMQTQDRFLDLLSKFGVRY